MEEYIPKLRTLQSLIQGTDDFEKSMKFFMDNLAVQPDFIATSTEVQNEFLDKILQETGRYMFDKKEIEVQLNRYLTVSYYEFIHGFAFLEGRPMTIIYFPAIRLGAFVMVDGSVSHYGRLRALPVTTSKQFPDVKDSISLN